MFLLLAQNKKTLSDMKHRQEKTPTPFELFCGVYQPQISPMRRGKAKKVDTGSPALQKGRGWNISSSKDPICQNYGESWHSSQEPAMTLVAEDVLAQQESGTNQTVWKTHL